MSLEGSVCVCIPYLVTCCVSVVVVIKSTLLFIINTEAKAVAIRKKLNGKEV